MINLQHLSKEPPEPIRIEDDWQRTLPLALEALDFAKECLEDLWNTGPDENKPPELDKLKVWCVGWFVFDQWPDELGTFFPTAKPTYYVKEASFELVACKMRIQCLVRSGDDTSLVFNWEYLETVQTGEATDLPEVPNATSE